MFCKSYFQALIEGAESTGSLLPKITHAAGLAARLLADGGSFYLASVRPDFVSEGYVRSGGLMLLQEYRAGKPMEGDVVVVGWSDTEHDAERELVFELKSTGAYLVGIGPEVDDLSGVVDVFLPSQPPCPQDVLTQLQNQPYPLVSLQNLILLWMWTGELVSGLTRHSIMPVLYQSVLVPGARERNASFDTRRFHPTHDVPPIPPGELGSTFLSSIAACLSALLAEGRALARAAEIAVEVLEAGSHIHAFLLSHFPVHQAGAPGDPGYMKRLDVWKGEVPDVDELDRKLKPGDLFFFLGYYRRPVEAYEIARSRQCRIVEIITGAEDQPADVGQKPDHAIDPGWHYTDSLVDVPGYDVRILPASGIMQAAVYWSIVGEITESLQR